MPDLENVIHTNGSTTMDIATVTAKRNAKDSVFCHLFSDKRYLVELYQVLTGELIHEDEIETNTLESHLTNQLYNDLSFTARDQMMILLEEQSSWSVNIVIRMVLYLAGLWNKQIKQRGLKIHNQAAVKLPAPKFYVVYTGGNDFRPKTLSLKDDIFNGADTSIDASVEVLYGDSGENNILNQYVEFCKILNIQFSKFGRTMEAVKETIRICKERDVLRDYLEKEEQEVIDIMERLLSQEEILKEYVMSEREDAVQSTLLATLQKMVTKLHLSVDEAMDTLEIPQNERALYAASLAKQ